MREMRSIVSTLGGSGVTQVFTHHITSAADIGVLKAVTPGYKHFDQRALLLARPDDIVCVRGTVDETYVEFLSQLGLGPKRDHIVELGVSAGDEETMLPDLLRRNSEALESICQRIPSKNRVVLNPYSVAKVEFVVAAELEKRLEKPVHVLGGNPEIVAYANLKHLVHAKAHERGIPVAPGEVVELPGLLNGNSRDLAYLQGAIGRYVHQTGRVIIRGTDGTAGSAIATVGNDSESQRRGLSALCRGPVSKVYLVQVMYKIVTSPNLQLFVEPDSGAISCVSVTDQRLDNNLKHKGNVAPSSVTTLTDMSHSAEMLARWLQTKGFTGLVGFDFVEYVHPQSGKRRHILAEINARTNAATYPKFLVEHLNARQTHSRNPYIGAFLSATITTRARSFSELRKLYGHFFFNHQTGRGAIPFNTGCLEEGRCSMAFLGGSRSEVEQMYKDFVTLE